MRGNLTKIKIGTLSINIGNTAGAIMSNDARRGKQGIIKASEIGQYKFCSVAWFLQKRGYTPESPLILAGRKRHVEIGDGLKMVWRMKRIFRILLWIGLLMIFLALMGL